MRNQSKLICSVITTQLLVASIALGCPNITETGRRKLNGFEKCELQMITLIGEVIADNSNGNAEPEIAFGPFKVEAHFVGEELQLQLFGKDWTSNTINMNFIETEYNHIPFSRILSRDEIMQLGGNWYHTEYNDIRIRFGNVSFSEKTNWLEPTIILYGRGVGYFGSHAFEHWTFSANLERGGVQQKIIANGNVEFDRSSFSRSGCSMDLTVKQ